MNVWRPVAAAIHAKARAAVSLKAYRSDRRELFDQTLLRRYPYRCRGAVPVRHPERSTLCGQSTNCRPGSTKEASVTPRRSASCATRCNKL
jgi:hypothetical protein